MLANHMKRLLSGLLVLVMVLSLVPVYAFADTTDSTQQLQTEQTDCEINGHSVTESEEVPALCEDDGMTAGTYCAVCGITLSGRTPIAAKGHDVISFEAKKPTYTSVGWEAYESCTKCAYSTYVEIPALGEAQISDYDSFVMNLYYLEMLADEYVRENPGKDPVDLVIKYIRTGVERYNSGSWGIMAGYEDADFAKFVAQMEDAFNSQMPEEEQLMVTGLKNLKTITLPNGDRADLGHMFGTMDITYHNKFGVNHADVAGWTGDLVDLLEYADKGGVTGTVEQMVAQISDNYLLQDTPSSDIPGMNQQDMYGDMDALYIMKTLQNRGYSFEDGGLATLLMEYFTEELSDEDRADFFIKNRMEGISSRQQLREAVYQAYMGNQVISTLEGTREFTTTNLADLRKAVCYAFADYICKLAGDYVETTENLVYEEFSSETNILAPGITQQIKLANSLLDGQQMAYYLTIADVTREDVQIYANYNNNDPAAGWAMQRVLDQANAAQAKYGDPESEHYIENYNVIASVNGAGFNMQTGQPSGLLVMHGVEYSPIDGKGFFGILKDGTPVIATTAEYNAIYKGQIQEAIAGFGDIIIDGGQILPSAEANRASRTAVGITKTGKVVFLVLDGRQEPFSCGGGMNELAQILIEAGCVKAMNLDGGGSTTYVARQPGDEELSVVNRPSDGFARSVSTSWLVTSTAPSSTAFDHAILDSTTDYMTVGASLQITPFGVSPTGNTVDLPEGTTWAVANTRWGTITEDGLFTAKRAGSVDVYLKLGDEIIGSKTVYIVTPNNIQFTKTQIDTVFGATVDLPVKMFYEGKEVVFTENDLEFTLSNSKAGTVEGLKFICSSNENSGIKNVTVTAALASDSSVTANATISLYKQGEMSFDFDQATGGDRSLAWYRQVSNATKDSQNAYTVIDPEKEMVTNYTLAIDMTQIPIPEKLEDLTYMLPGSDVEGASAWTFLMQLAERISPLTEITATVQFDSDMEVDISGLTLVNEYFTLSGTQIDEETNTVTLILNWKKQTAAINADTANPMCIVSGIKLTPKADVDWGAKGRLELVHSGSIGYKVYMRASALYSFSQKEDNQKVFGLYPYRNPDDSKDAGGYFQDVYKTFQDSYTLTNVLKNGWVAENGGYAYYVDGVRYTGICQVDGLYYDFGTDGVCLGQKTYTGMINEDGKLYYARAGKLASGWTTIGSDYYYFNTYSYQAHTGVSTIGGRTYTFSADGKLLKGAFLETSEGLRYFWAGTLVARGWVETEDGTLYANDNGYIVFGNYPVKQNATEDAVWMHFDETTGALTGICDGFVTFNGAKYYCDNGVWYYGAVQTENGIVFCGTNGLVSVNRKCYVDQGLETTAGLATGNYWCGADGYILATGFATIDGSVYYYDNYVSAKGFTKVGENYYFFNTGSGKMFKNTTLWVSGSNPYGITGGYYIFQADGSMYIPDPNGEKKVIEENGELYFTIDGVKQRNGLNELDGEYYFAASNGVLAVNKSVYISNFNDLIAPGAGYFGFDAEGKLITTGFVVGGGATFYYNNLQRAKGFTKIGEDYYFFNAGSGKLYTDATLWVGDNPYGIVGGYYIFQADGTMYIPDPNGERKVVEENGKLYFTIDGVKQRNGLNELDGDYYFAGSNGVLAVNTSVYISNFNDLIAPGAGYFGFDAEGKLITTGFVVGGGATFYYNNLQRAKGFTKIGEDYYFFNAGSGKMYTNMTLWVGNNPYGIVGGYYNFQADGTMYIPDPNGEKKVVEENGNLYFTIDGVKQRNGLNELDGSYYYANSNGVLAVNTVIYISNFNDLMAPGAGYFGFDAQGKLITTGFVTRGSETYYYNDLQRAKGFVKIGEDFYFFNAGSGKMYTNARLWVGNNAYGITGGYYEFGADGKMI